MKRFVKDKTYTNIYDSLTDYKRDIRTYVEKDDFKVKRNRRKAVNDLWEGEGLKRSFHGTDNLQELKTLRRYIAPSKLKALRKDVAENVKHIHVEDVRRRVTFNDSHGKFVPERYFAGDTRKPFATLSNRKQPLPTITVVLNMGYNAGTDAHSEAPYNSIAGIIFAEMLQKQGYGVNIYVMEHGIGDGTNNMSLVKVKDARTYMDSDTLAIVASDPRFFRFWGFMGIAVSYDKAGKGYPFGLGTHAPREESEKFLQSIDFKYDFIFGKSFSHNQAVNQLKKALGQLDQRATA